MRFLIKTGVSQLRSISVVIISGITLSVFGCFTGQAQPGIEEDTLLFGMSTVLEGPTSTLGQNMQEGVEAAFNEINLQGGIQGRKLILQVLDDGYEPERTVPNLHQLIDEEGVLAILGNVGTPTAVAAIPIVNQKKVPFIAAYSGAGVLRKSPPDRYVVNFRASYDEEVTAMVDALIGKAGIQPEEIAFFTQRDAYGDSVYTAGITTLKKYGLDHERQVAHGRYERNTLAVENGLADILYHNPPVKAVIMVGTYAPCAEFIRLGKKYGLDVTYLGISFMGAAPIKDAIGDIGDGMIVTQVVPHFDESLPIIREYYAALHAYDANLQHSFGRLEGYIASRMLIYALQKIEDMPTRENLIDALESLGEFDLGLQEKLTLSPTDHQACDTVWASVIRDGQIVPFDWDELATIMQGSRDD